MEEQFKTIGKIEQHIFKYLEQVMERLRFERLKVFLSENNIDENDIIYMLVNENDNERLFTMRIKNYDDDLYFRVPKEA